MVASLFLTSSATVAAAVLFLAGRAVAVELPGVTQPINPQEYGECVDLRRTWYERLQLMEREASACDKRDGGTVNPTGVWLPNCGRRQQAYVTCAAVSDQVCQVRNAMSSSVQACNTQVAGAMSRRRQEKSLLSEIERTTRAAQQANEAIRGIAEQGPADYLVDRYMATPESAAGRLNDAVKEAARTIGTTAPDSQPVLNRVGEGADRIWKTTPYSPVIKEIGQQSSAAARARMGDALGELDGSLEGAEAEGEADSAARKFSQQRTLNVDLLPPCRPTNVRDPRLAHLPPCRAKQ